jgi:hypothetical protein
VFIGCVDVTISGNTLLYIGGSAIGNYQWNADTRKASNVSITGNLISTTLPPSAGPAPLTCHGILLGWCQQTTVIGNTISDVGDDSPYTTAGVFLYGYNSVFVKGNVIKNCVGHGVYVYDSTPSASSDLKELHIEDNTFFNVVKYAIRANPTTAFLNSVFIKGNTYKDCAYDASVSGVVVSAGRTQATPLRYYANVLLNNETQTVVLDPANASNIIESNNIPSF